MQRYLVFAVCLVVGATLFGESRAEGSAERGREVFSACAACHSFEPGEHRTGPSLSGIWNKQAGTAEGFRRYSKVLRESGIVWDETSLDAWLADPRAFLPGNRMTFRGLADATQRQDLIAFLRQVSDGGMAHGGTGPMQGGMGGMMGASEPLDLRALGPDNRIASIAYCGDTYDIAMENGELHQFWEFNLRIKTDGSARGPEPSHPVLIPASMMGDRAFLVFAKPQEISEFIAKGC